MTSQEGFNGAARLVVLNGSMADQVVPLQGASLIVGRDFSTNLRFDSPYLSAQHARLDQSNGNTYVSDLGSQNGTTVNAMRIQSTIELHDGDIVYFADIGTRFQAPGQNTFAPPSPSGQVGMNVGALTGDRVTVAGRDVNFFERRNDFLRDIASSRSKATWLLVLGFFMFIGGFATFIVGLYQSAEQARSDFERGIDSFGSGNRLGPEVGGIPIVAIGYGLAFIGIVLSIIGLVLHIVAAARKRSFESEWATEGRLKGYL